MIRFGTGGWRAVIGDDFICENIRRVAAGIAKLAHEQNKAETPIPPPQQEEIRPN